MNEFFKISGNRKSAKELMFKEFWSGNKHRGKIVAGIKTREMFWKVVRKSKKTLLGEKN